MEHLAAILFDNLGFFRCVAAPQFHWNTERGIALELHMDDIHGAGDVECQKQFINDLSREIEGKGGDGCILRQPYEHL